MRSPITSRAASGSAVLGLLVSSLFGFALAGCRTFDDHGAYLADAVPIDVAERHPIVVSQQPATMNLHVARGATGLSPGQKVQLTGFLQRYRGSDAGNSKLLLAVPAGSANESSVVRAVADMRRIIGDFGFPDSAVAIQPYRARREEAAPIRFAYMRYVAQAPACGIWDTNLAYDRVNVPYTNFGCAQQHNLAMQIANPADLIGPRTMDPPDAERRSVVFDKYRQGTPTGATRSADESTSSQSSN
ncbi:MAG TPA: CpaD family pilus assembly protein [Hyphomicrobiaceae bacterium]|jgi:pilus assembly protein CpaD|nr:CpaD family pilus assembly protein [Hyphomicrobiaceae bacterium]